MRFGDRDVHSKSVRGDRGSDAGRLYRGAWFRDARFQRRWELFATHLPLISRRIDSRRVLLGHVARANPHWRLLSGNPHVLAIFTGPHSYISPTWYATAPAVPTWNYTAVHVYGAARVFDDAESLTQLLDKLISTYESPLSNPWSGELPAEFKSKLLKAIVGIEIEVRRIEGKFKFSQNLPLEDQRSMLTNLAVSPENAALDLADFARSFLGLN
jgi:transcriptional regulator